MGSIGFLVDFEFSMADLGVGRVPIGLVAPLRFKMLDSQPDSSNMGQVSIDFHEFCDFLNSWGSFLTRYLSCFRSGCFTIHIFQVFGRNQKDARRKVMQIRGGITSGSALFDPFVAIQDFRFLLMFVTSSVFPVSGLPKKCALIISVNRSSMPQNTS